MLLPGHAVRSLTIPPEKPNSKGMWRVDNSWLAWVTLWIPPLTPHTWGHVFNPSTLDCGGRGRQEDLEFKVILSYSSSKLVWNPKQTEKPVWAVFTMSRTWDGSGTKNPLLLTESIRITTTQAFLLNDLKIIRAIIFIYRVFMLLIISLHIWY